MDTQETNTDNEKSSFFNALKSLWASIEELTNLIGSILGSDQDDLHDRSNGF